MDSSPGDQITKRQRTILFAALTIATLAKLLLALKASETLDSNAYIEFLNVIRAKGGVALYDFRGTFNNPFIFPPAIIHLINALGWISDVTGLPFKFWLRSLPSLADVGSFFVIWRLLRGHKDLFRILFLLALCPTSILINGYEGNLDGFMIFPVLLAVCLIETKKPLWWAGAAYGIALNIKAVPLMFIFAFFFSLKSTKARIQFFSATAIVMLVSSMPFLLQNPAIIRKVFGYASIYGGWGITKLAVIFTGPAVYLHWPYDPTGGHATFASILKWVTIIVILIVSFLMNRSKERVHLLKQLGIVVAIFLFLTPGFGVQYLVWLVPFVTAAGLRATAIYYFTTTLYLVFVVDALSCSDFGCNIWMFLCWLSIGVVVFEFYRGLGDHPVDFFAETNAVTARST